jgi:hypothetical protein
VSLVEPRRSEVVEPPAPMVVDGEVVRVVEIHPYPNATAPLGGCTSFRGVYVTDPDEIAAIRRRIGRGSDPGGPHALPQAQAPKRARPPALVSRVGAQMDAWAGFVFGSVTSIAANVLHAWLPVDEHPPGAAAGASTRHSEQAADLRPGTVAAER